MKWRELVLHVPPQEADALAQVVQPLCHGGVVVEPALVTVAGSEDFSFSDEQPTLIKAYLPQDRGFGLKRYRLLNRVRAHNERVAVIEREIEEADWAIAWQKHFKAIRVGRRLVIKPTWQPYRRRPKDVIIELDPGMAFGTGDHPTTQACLKTLEQRMTPRARVMDVGTGTGILAIAAAKLGASAVLALDTDPLSVKAAQANSVLNDVEVTITVRLGSLDPRLLLEWGKADLLLANLTSQLHLELAHGIVTAIHPGGTVVASGIGAASLQSVKLAYRSAGAADIAVRRQGQWRTLIVRTVQ